MTCRAQGAREDQAPGLPVDLPSMADPEHENQESVILDRIDHPVGSDPNAVKVASSRQFLHVGRSRVHRQCIDSETQSLSNNSGKGRELPPGARLEGDGVGHRLEPGCPLNLFPGDRFLSGPFHVRECLACLANVDLILESLEELEILDGNDDGHRFALALDRDALTSALDPIEHPVEVLAHLACSELRHSDERRRFAPTAQPESCKPSLRSLRRRW